MPSKPPRRPFFADDPTALPVAPATAESVQRADPERLRASMARVYEIFHDIAVVADDVMTRRCPYKDRFDRCTAEFGCRNQRPDAESDRFHCVGDDRLDYRGAWETAADPASD